MDCFRCETSNLTGATSCDGCNPGMFKDSVTNQCLDCEAGRFSSERDSPSCTDCPRGFHGVEITLTKTRIECIGCPRGTFGDKQAMQNKSTCKDCEAGRYSDVDALPSTGPTIVPCKECPRGRWSDVTGVQESGGCKNCNPGKYSTAVAAKLESTCTKCSAGTHSATTGLSDPSQCRACPLGFSQPEEGQVFCFQCVPGRYQDQYAQSNCQLCPANQFANETEMTRCHVCPVGTSTSGRQGSAFCQACIAGRFGDQCSSCLPGKYRTGDDPDGTRCKSCPAGFYQSEEATTYCLGCEAGQYADRPMSNCTRCPSGKIVSEKRTASASLCKPCEIVDTIPNGAQSECVRPFVNGISGVPEEHQRWTEGGTFEYAVKLNFKPASPVIVRVTVAKEINTSGVSPGCNITQGAYSYFSVDTWDINQAITVTLDDDASFYAKDSISFSCNIVHSVVSSDGSSEYAGATLHLDAVSTGCGRGEFFGDFDRGNDGRQCVCSSNHYLPIDSDCLKCPSPQADCEERGLLAPKTAEGFWRAHPESRDLTEHPFYACPYKLACPGGNSTEAQCAKGHDPRTPLCASCLPGYFLQGVSPMQKCQICPDRESSETLTWELAVLTGGGFAVYMVFVVCEPAGDIKGS